MQLWTHHLVVLVSIDWTGSAQIRLVTGSDALNDLGRIPQRGYFRLRVFHVRLSFH